MWSSDQWADIFIVRRKGSDGRKGSMMNSRATCSTWTGMGSVRLYLAHDSPHNENKQPYHTGSVAARVNEDRAIRCTPGRRCQVCYWCIIKDSWKKQHHHRHMEHKYIKSCRETPGTNTRNGQVQMEHPWTLSKVPEGSGEQGKRRKLVAKSSAVPQRPSRLRDR